MIIGIGNDAVAIARFAQWATYPKTRLERLFSEQEIAYCLQEPRKSAERFAARFAAKEALYKALSQAGHQMPFLTLCAASEIVTTPHPSIHFLRNHSGRAGAACASPKTCHPEFISGSTLLAIHLSITHTNEYAYAFCILEKIEK